MISSKEPTTFGSERSASTPVTRAVMLPVAVVVVIVLLPTVQVTGLPVTVQVPEEITQDEPAGITQVKFPKTVTAMVVVPIGNVMGLPVQVPVPLVKVVATPVVPEAKALGAIPLLLLPPAMPPIMKNVPAATVMAAPAALVKAVATVRVPVPWV